jgi:hypothetical protein
MMSIDESSGGAGGGLNAIAIPSTLRTIQPFLDDAQKFVR